MLTFFVASMMFILIFLVSSFNSLMFLLMVEGMVLTSLLILMLFSTSWVVSIFFLLVCVCMGAYGVCLLISLNRSKGFSFFFSF